QRTPTGRLVDPQRGPAAGRGEDETDGGGEPGRTTLRGGEAAGGEARPAHRGVVLGSPGEVEQSAAQLGRPARSAAQQRMDLGGAEAAAAHLGRGHGPHPCAARARASGSTTPRIRSPTGPTTWSAIHTIGSVSPQVS